MTLVYAKIIGMFVCGAESWGRGGGWGLGGVPGNFQNWIQHIDGCLWGGWGCTYVRMLRMYILTYIFVIKNSDLDPHILRKYVGHRFKSKSWIKNSKLFFRCMRHFSCRWYRPPEVYLN